MGYQESFITTTNKNNFDDFIDRIKAIGEGYYINNGCQPSFIVTIKQNVHGVYEKRIKLKQNNKYVYFTGERHLQRSPYTILNIGDLDPLPFNLDIIFCEDIGGSVIFDASKKKQGAVYSGLNNEFVEVVDFKFS